MTWNPELRQDLIVVEQSYRGELTYIIKDPRTFKYFRFKPLEMMVLQEFDGERTPVQVAAVLAESGIPVAAKTVDGFSRRLKKMGLLKRSLSEKSVLMLERLRTERRRRVKGTHYHGSLLRMRWSVGDPDSFFERTIPWIKFFFTPAFVKTSLALFAIYFVVLFLNWPVVASFVKTLYTPSSYTVQLVVGFWATTLMLLVIHELAHGYVCKHFGGQVYEMGAMLIYFSPAFYCNVNDSWTFPELRKRLWVTAAGSWIELVVAGIAGVIWMLAEPGTILWMEAALVFTFGGIMTVLANVNPLIPLDGYYALSDYLEIPNLRLRAFEYLRWILKRHALRLDIPEPDGDYREKRVFVIYGLLSFVYIAGIFYFIGGLVFGWLSRGLGAIGVVLFAALLWAALRSTIRDWASSVATSVREHRTRWSSRRFIGGSAGIVAVVLLAGFLRWPITTSGTFVSAPSLITSLSAPESASIVDVMTHEGATVSAGTPLMVLRSFTLEMEIAETRRNVDLLESQLARSRSGGNRAAEQRLAAELQTISARLSGLEDRSRSLTIRAPITGIVTSARVEESMQMRVEPGDTLINLASIDSIELRLSLNGIGAALASTGDPVRLVFRAHPGKPTEATLASVSAAARNLDAGAPIEARIRLPRHASHAFGATGEARVVLRYSNLFYAVWWGVRGRLRGDILL